MAKTAIYSRLLKYYQIYIQNKKQLHCKADMLYLTLFCSFFDIHIFQLT